MNQQLDRLLRTFEKRMSEKIGPSFRHHLRCQHFSEIDGKPGFFLEKTYSREPHSGTRNITSIVRDMDDERRKTFTVRVGTIEVICSIVFDENSGYGSHFEYAIRTHKSREPVPQEGFESAAFAVIDQIVSDKYTPELEDRFITSLTVDQEAVAAK
jgi:hypothetical protein